MDIQAVYKYVQQKAASNTHINGISLYKNQKLQKDISYFEKLSLKDLSIITSYMSKSRRKVGIDIGTSRFISASDSELHETFTYYPDYMKDMNNVFSHILRTQKSILQRDLNLKHIIEAAYKSSAEAAADNLISIYGENATFVIGTPSDNPQPLFTIMQNSLIQALSCKMNVTHIHTAREDNSSITCPRCMHSDKNNLIGLHDFYCTACGFTHPNNDLVAACNIANNPSKMISMKQGTVSIKDVNASVVVRIEGRQKIIITSANIHKECKVPNHMSEFYRKYDESKRHKNQPEAHAQKKLRQRMQAKAQVFQDIVKIIHTESKAEKSVIITYNRSKDPVETKIISELLQSLIKPDRKITIK